MTALFAAVFALGWLASYYANKRRFINIGWEQGRCYSERLRASTHPRNPNGTFKQKSDAN